MNHSKIDAGDMSPVSILEWFISAYRQTVIKLNPEKKYLKKGGISILDKNEVLVYYSALSYH